MAASITVSLPIFKQTSIAFLIKFSDDFDQSYIKMFGSVKSSILLDVFICCIAFPFK